MAMPMAAAARAFSAAPFPAGGHAFVSSARAAATTTRAGARRAVVVVLSHPPDSSSWDGQLVDADMATLRRRIREATEAAEEEEDEEEIGGGIPAEWTELERRHHGSYVAGVRGAAGVVQALLVSARPGLGAGLLALLLLSVSASVLTVSAQLLHAVDAVASALLSGR